MLSWYSLIILYHFLLLNFSTDFFDTTVKDILIKYSVIANIELDSLSFFPPELSFKKLDIQYKKCSVSLKNLKINTDLRDIFNTSLVISKLNFENINLKLDPVCFSANKTKPIQFIKIKEINGKKLKIHYKKKEYNFKNLYFVNDEESFLNIIGKSVIEKDDFISLSLRAKDDEYSLEKLAYKSVFSELELYGTYNKNIDIYGNISIKNLKKFQDVLCRYIDKKQIPDLSNLYFKNFNAGFKLKLNKNFSVLQSMFSFKAKDIGLKQFKITNATGKLKFKNKKFKLYDLSLERNHVVIKHIKLTGKVKKNPSFRFKFDDLTIKTVTDFAGAKFPFLTATASGYIDAVRKNGKFDVSYSIQSKQLNILACFEDGSKNKILHVQGIDINGTGDISNTYNFLGTITTKHGDFNYKIMEENGAFKIVYNAPKFHLDQNFTNVHIKSNLQFKGYLTASMTHVFSKSDFITKDLTLFHQLKMDGSKFIMYFEDYVLKFSKGVTPLKTGDEVYTDVLLDFSGDKSIFDTLVKTDAITLKELSEATGFEYPIFTGVYKGSVRISGLMSDYFTYKAKGLIYNFRIPRAYLSFGDLNVDASIKGNIFKGEVFSDKFKIKAFPYKKISKFAIDIKSADLDLIHDTGRVALKGTLTSKLLDFKTGNLKGNIFLDRLGFFPFSLVNKQKKWLFKLDYKNRVRNSELKLNGELAKNTKINIEYKNIFADFVQTISGINIYADLKLTGKIKILNKDLYLKNSITKIYSGDKIFNLPKFSLNYIDKNIDFSPITIESENENCSLKISKDKGYRYKGCLNSAFLRVFFPATFSGYFDFDLIYNKFLDGNIFVKNTILNINNLIFEINGKLPVHQDSVVFNALKLKLNNNLILVKGDAKLFPVFIPKLSFNLLDIPITYEKFYGYFGGNLSLTGKAPYLVKGKILVRDSIYRFGEYSKKTKPFDIDDKFRFDVLLNMQNILLDNTDMRFTLDGRGEIKGSINNYSGIANLKEGRIKYLDREFDLQHGTVKFKKGEYEYNVSFDSTIAKYLVNIDAKGKNMENLNVNLRATPFLTEEQIVSLLMTGEPYREANSPITHLTITNEFKKQIGFDVGINYKGLNENMSIELKKDLSKNLKLKYNRDISNVGEQKIDLEYRITKNIDLDASVRGDTAFEKANNSIGIKFKHEF